MKEKEINLKELKQEANNVEAISQVQEAVVNFFQLKSWEEAITKFGLSVCSERLLRFKVKLMVASFYINFKQNCITCMYFYPEKLPIF